MSDAPDGATTWVALGNAHLEVGVIEFGARLALLRAPDRHGVPGEVVLGLDAAGYRRDRAYLGATVGRYANRIAGGEFVLDGRRYAVPANEGRVALHGGRDGFERRRFVAEPVAANPVVDGPGGTRSVTLRRTSPDGESGFPGTLEVAVTYTLRDRELHIEHTATTDAPTVVNLTNHAYFNLAGRGTVADHRIRIPASAFLPVDDELVPTGEYAPVVDTPFDLRAPTRIGANLGADHPQLRRTGGFDHTFVLDRPDGPDAGGLAVAAHVEEPRSGRTLTLLTDQPGVQFYSGNLLDGSTVLRDGTAVGRHEAFCLEPQRFPNAPNEPRFPDTVLRPGQRYRSRIILRFGVTV